MAKYRILLLTNTWLWFYLIHETTKVSRDGNSSGLLTTRAMNSLMQQKLQVLSFGRPKTQAMLVENRIRKKQLAAFRSDPQNEARDVDFGYWVKNRDGSDAIVKVPREVYDQVPEEYRVNGDTLV
ncbi:hypothetical protein VTN96DRAFT_8381 [Rasamsonia emersonii]